MQGSTLFSNLDFKSRKLYKMVSFSDNKTYISCISVISLISVSRKKGRVWKLKVLFYQIKKYMKFWKRDVGHIFGFIFFGRRKWKRQWTTQHFGFGFWVWWKWRPKWHRISRGSNIFFRARKAKRSTNGMVTHTGILRGRVKGSSLI